MRSFPIALILCLCGLSAFAQFQLPGLGGGLPTTAPGADFATYAQLFGKSAAFTAHSQVRVQDKNQKETLSASMEVTMLENKLRLDIDAAATKNSTLPAGAMQMLQQMGMDQVVVIMRPDRAKVHFVFPKAQIGLNLPMDQQDLDRANRATVRTEALGEETMAGYACKKSKVTINSADGDKQVITVWRATDLKDFPIQTVQQQDEDTITTRYSKIQFTKPETKQFELPANVQLYNGTTEFMQGMMKKALSSSLPGGQ